MEKNTIFKTNVVILALFLGAVAFAEARPIGVFDSGVGGLTVLEQMLAMDLYDNESGKRESDGRPDFENEKFLYFGDQANMPYGDYAAAGKSDYLKKLIVADAEFLLARKSKILAIACNTATAWGLREVTVRGQQNGVETLGVIDSGVGSALALLDKMPGTGAVSIGVMATPGTIASGAYERTVNERIRALGIKRKVKVFSQGCAGLADAVEAGSSQANKIAIDNFNVLKAKHDADKDAGPMNIVILGCTHFPFILPELQKVAPNVNFVDPAVAMAEECYLILRKRELLNKSGAMSLKMYISVPATGLDKRYLDANGALTRECKYSRELADKTVWTMPKRYTSIDAANNSFVRKQLPKTWKLLSGTK